MVLGKSPFSKDINCPVVSLMRRPIYESQWYAARHHVMRSSAGLGQTRDVTLFTPSIMSSRARGNSRKTIRVFRDDDDIVDGHVVTARAVGLSRDGRRVKTVVSGTCAQAQDSTRTDWQSTFNPGLADVLDQEVSGPRRYINSVRRVLPSYTFFLTLGI